VFQFVCDVVKDAGKEEYLRPFIHIGLDSTRQGLCSGMVSVRLSVPSIDRCMRAVSRCQLTYMKLKLNTDLFFGALISSGGFAGEHHSASGRDAGSTRYHLQHWRYAWTAISQPT